MIKFSKSKIVAAAATGLILMGAMGTVVMAGGNSNEGNLLSRCRSMLCAENEVCRDESQCMSNRVCNANGSCVENGICVNGGSCVTDETYTTGNRPGGNGADTDTAINGTSDPNTANQTDVIEAVASVSENDPQYSEETYQNEAGTCYGGHHGYSENQKNYRYHHGNTQDHGGHHGGHH